MQRWERNGFKCRSSNKMASGARRRAAVNSSEALKKSRGQNKTSMEAEAMVKSHIESFPAMDSHYVRANTSRKFLDSNLNLTKMYDLYVKQCAEAHSKIKIVSSTHYQKIFYEDFNLGFHIPKKDFCDFCQQYANSTADEKQKLQCEMDAHQARKERVRLLKAELKRQASVVDNLIVATYDLEKVLQSPKLNVGSLYYKRKLSVHNFTIYSLANHNVDCYMWHEGVAGRGSCEIATCLYSFFKDVDPAVTHFVGLSDTCGGQNRNVNVSAMCLFATQKTNLEIIDQIYMEKGHSQMEVDSCHSVIERAVKNVDIYCPMDYYALVKKARTKQPYVVHQVETESILNFKEMVGPRCFLRNKNRDDSGRVVNWLKIKWLRYRKSHPGTIQFRYDYDSDFCTIVVNKAVRGHPNTISDSVGKLYSAQPGITQAKYKDLLSLCDCKAIPADYHGFYSSLSVNGSELEVVPEPGVDDADDVDGDVV